MGLCVQSRQGSTPEHRETDPIRINTLWMISGDIFTFC